MPHSATMVVDYGNSPTITANSIGAVDLIGDGLVSVELIINERHGGVLSPAVAAHLILPVSSLIPGAQHMINASALAGAARKRMS